MQKNIVIVIGLIVQMVEKLETSVFEVTLMGYIN